MRLLTRIASVMLVALLAACAQQPAQQTPLTPLPYTDDFSNSQSGWQTLNDLSADVKYDNGALRITVKQENVTQWSAAGKRFKDGVIEVDAKAIAGPTDNGYGVLFHMKDRKNYYHFEISSDGYWKAGWVQDGAWKDWNDWQPHPAIKGGAENNKLKIVMKGEKFTFFVNDQEISTIEDKLFSEGDIAMFALSVIDQPGTDITFDNVSVTESK